MKILYIGNKIDVICSGADAINKRNQYLLETIVGSNNVYYQDLPNTNNIFIKWDFGISGNLISKVSAIIQINNITHVFISQSLLGRIAQFIRKKYSYIKIITFLHNIEVDYAKGYLKSKGVKALPFYFRAKKRESDCICNSDILITLNKRDSKRLNELYGKQANTELPTSFTDVFQQVSIPKSSISNEKIILFVGVAFFPNIEGIQWFIDNVLPHVTGTLHVVGKGMDKVPFRNVSNRIKIHGFVENLSDEYAEANIVVSPIFTGAGMKTKTAEALMYGKTIIGTTEAFEGYVIDSKCMIVANNKEEFISAIKQTSQWNKFNTEARELFKREYETSALITRVRNILLNDEFQNV